MNKKITSVNLGTAIVIGLALVLGVLAGVMLPAVPAQDAPVTGGAQAVTNAFRQVAIKSADDSQPLSITLYTTPTANALTVNDSDGTALFTIDSEGGVTAGTLTVTTLISQAIGIDQATAVITDLTSVNITGTLATASQTNVTNLGTQTYFTATNAALTNVTGPFTMTDDFTALNNFTATNGIIVSGMAFTYTEPITITDVLTNVRLLFYQVP